MSSEGGPLGNDYDSCEFYRLSQYHCCRLPTRGYHARSIMHISRFCCAQASHRFPNTSDNLWQSESASGSSSSSFRLPRVADTTARRLSRGREAVWPNYSPVPITFLQYAVHVQADLRRRVSRDLTLILLSAELVLAHRNERLRGDHATFTYWP